MQMALLDWVAQPGNNTAMQQVDTLYQDIPKQQVDFQLKDLERSIHRQRNMLDHLNVINLNFQDPLEAKISCDFLCELFPDPSRAKLGIMELFINAIEHGNLGISYEEKHTLLAENRWMEEITHRLSDPANNEKRVHAYCYRDPAYTRITIRDDGEGFDWRPYESMTAHDTLNGRGIAVAKHISFDEMGYYDQGNIVYGMQYQKE